MLELHPSEEVFRPAGSLIRSSSQPSDEAAAASTPRRGVAGGGLFDSSVMSPKHLSIVSGGGAEEEGGEGDEAIDFDEIDEDLARFQEDEVVKSALHRGVDLRKYGHELSKQLKEVKKTCREVS
jgi:hypothetical protein